MAQSPRRSCFAALLGADVEQIESAIGLVVAHYIPFRAIRHGHQLSDSKGASAALSAEVAVLRCPRRDARLRRPGRHFPQRRSDFLALRTAGRPDSSPFDLTLSCGRRRFRGDGNALQARAVRTPVGRRDSRPDRFAGRVSGAIWPIRSRFARIEITIYEPAFHIIADPAKRNPTTRQSADHSLPYIVATLFRKAIEQQRSGWRELMLMPDDYSDAALQHPLTRRLNGPHATSATAANRSTTIIPTASPRRWPSTMPSSAVYPAD